MEVQMQGLTLGWGRTPEGRFMVATAAGGVILQTFVFTAAEEEALRAELATGMVLAPASALADMKAKAHEDMAAALQRAGR